LKQEGNLGRVIVEMKANSEQINAAIKFLLLVVGEPRKASRKERINAERFAFIIKLLLSNLTD
jgi:hypothetical protein